MPLKFCLIRFEITGIPNFSNEAYKVVFDDVSNVIVVELTFDVWYII